MATRLALRLVLLAGVSALLVVALALRGGSPGITFAQANGFNLTIDSRSIYNGVAVPSATWGLKNLTPGTDKFFNITDVKPGDTGETTISFHVNMDAWLCMDFKNLQNLENGINEPEGHVDVTPLRENLQPGQSSLRGATTATMCLRLAKVRYLAPVHKPHQLYSTTKHIRSPIPRAPHPLRHHQPCMLALRGVRATSPSTCHRQ